MIEAVDIQKLILLKFQQHHGAPTVADWALTQPGAFWADGNGKDEEEKEEEEECVTSDDGAFLQGRLKSILSSGEREWLFARRPLSPSAPCQLSLRLSPRVSGAAG